MLPQDFQFSKFGITARLVSEEDAKTIVSFRSDPKRTQYMIEKIYADVHKENKKAIKLLELLNFRFIDTETDFFDLILDRKSYFQSLENSIIANVLK